MTISNALPSKHFLYSQTTKYLVEPYYSVDNLAKNTYKQNHDDDLAYGTGIPRQLNGNPYVINDKKGAVAFYTI